MYQIMIVEDEPLVRIAFKSMIEWEKYGFTVTKEAVNGQEALEKFLVSQVNVIVTDIRMPVMDGIELIKQIKLINPETVCIVLSAYDDFKLVKDAFQLGIFDYVLKPEMDSSRLIKLSEQITNHLDKLTKDNQLKRQTEKNSLSNLRLMKENFIKELIWGQGFTQEGYDREIERLQLRIKGEKLCIATIMVDNFAKVLEQHGDDGIMKFNQSMVNMIDSIMEKQQLGEVTLNGNNEYIVVLTFPETSSQNNIKNQLIEMFDRIKQSAYNYINIKLSIGISHIQMRGFNDIYKLYRETKVALDYSFIIGHGNTIFYEKLPINSYAIEKSHNYFDNIKSIKLFLQHEGNMDTSEVYKKVAIKNNIILINTIGEIKELYSTYLLLLSEYANKKLANQILVSVENFRKAIKENVSLEELNEMLRACLGDVHKYSQNKENSLTLSAKRYIYEHFHETINLYDVAKELNVSNEYLCRVFSQTEGKSFMKFLVEYRVDRAKEYIREGDVKIFEVANRVGYSSVTYFNQAFRKVTGMSPKEYKLKLTKKL